MYTAKLHNGSAWLAVYIDDLFTFEQNTAVFKELQQILFEAFEMRYLGPLRSMLGIDFELVGKGMLMHQENYAKKLLSVSTWKMLSQLECL